MRRVVLFALFALTLPFVWGETYSCNSPSEAYTGVELFTSARKNGIHFGLIILAPVLLGFLQRHVRSALVRLALELPAIVCGLLGALFCLAQAAFGGSIFSRGHSHPAPFIAAFAPFLMAVDACRGAAQRMTELLAERQRRRWKAAAAEDDVQPR